MAIISPSILSADFGHLHDEIDEVVRLGAEWIHVDVMDGRFVPNITIGPQITQTVKNTVGDRAIVDVHLMIVEPDRYIQDFRDAGADIITVHAEACTHLHRTLQAIRAMGAKAGVSLNPHTPESVIDYVLDMTDLVLVMTVNPGFGGQSFIESQLGKITRIRETIERRGLSTLIEVDGGVKVHNARTIESAGAHALVSGSGVFKAKDRAAAIKAIRGV